MTAVALRTMWRYTADGLETIEAGQGCDWVVGVAGSAYQEGFHYRIVDEPHRSSDPSRG